MKKLNKRAVATIAACLLGGIGVQAAPYFYWNGSVSTNWHDEGNWTIDRRGSSTVNLIPTVGDVAYISQIPANIPTISNVATTLTLRVAYTAGSEGILNIVDGADLTVAANKDRVGLSGGQGTVNQSGGTAELNYFGIGVGSGSVGEYNLSGGTLKMKSSNTLGGIGSTSMVLGDIGKGTFNLSGGTLETVRGVTISGSTEGDGTFSVFGDGVANLGGRSDLYAGKWYQGSFGKLVAEIDSDNGFSLGQINLLDGSNETPSVTFQYGATLDIDFSGADMGDVTNSWDLITWPSNTIITDNGLAFSSNMNLEVWSFAVTNNGLQVTYGIGSEEVIVTNPPPTGPRSIYWTGNGGSTDTQDAANWDDDLFDTAATWGIFSGDTLYVGHNDVNAAGSVSEATYAGGSDSLQNKLYIGRGREGILNFDSGVLTFPKANSGVVSYIGWGTDAGNGTLNMNGGTLDLNSSDMGTVAGAQGTINLNGGELLIPGRIASAAGNTDRASLWVGTRGTGNVNISGGSLKTLIGVVLGDAAGVGTFHVDGSGASLIDLGSTRGDFDGYWVQNSGSTLKVTIDEGGVTPINVREDGNDNGGTERVGLADLVFEAGSILDVGWAAGVTNYGIFDVMTFGGTVEDNGLAFAAGIDTDIWSFSFVDSDGNGTNDTLQVIADAETANGTSYAWLASHGLSEVDDEVDNDTDGMLTWEEYVAGTEPTNGNSVLVVNSQEVVGNDLILNWQSVEGKSYSIITNLSLTVGTPGVEASGIIGLPDETSYTGTISGASAVYYEIGVE